MNLKNLLRPLLQSALDSAMPTIKATLKGLLVSAVAKDGRVNALAQALFITIINNAVDAWTVKL